MAHLVSLSCTVCLKHGNASLASPCPAAPKLQADEHIVKTPQTKAVHPRWIERHHHTIRVFGDDSILDRRTRSGHSLVSSQYRMVVRTGRVERRKDDRRYYTFSRTKHLIRLCPLALSAAAENLVPMTYDRVLECCSDALSKKPLGNPRGIFGAIGLPVSIMCVLLQPVPVALN